MLSDEQIDSRLKEWATWVTVGDASGYPATNVLHESWSPGRGAMQVSAGVCRARDRERAVGAAIKQLSARLQDTVCVYYCKRLSVVEQAEVLGCGESTVRARVREARRLLGQWLSA